MWAGLYYGLSGTTLATTLSVVSLVLPDEPYNGRVDLFGVRIARRVLCRGTHILGAGCHLSQVPTAGTVPDAA